MKKTDAKQAAGNRHRGKIFKTYGMGFGNISRRVSWAPTVGSVLDSMPWKRLEEALGYAVQVVRHMLRSLSYNYTLFSCQLFSGFAPETLCLFALPKVALVTVGFHMSSLLRRQTWASIEVNPFPTAYMPAYRREIIHIHSYYPVVPGWNNYASLPQNKWMRAALLAPLLS